VIGRVALALSLLLAAEVALTVPAAASPKPAPPLLEQLGEAIVAAGLPVGLGVAHVEAPMLRHGEILAHAAVSWIAPPRAGWMSVAVRVESRHGGSRQAWARVELRPMCSVLVPTHDLIAGERILPGDVESVDRAVDPTLVLRISSALALGREIRRPLHAGEPLVRADLADATPIASGTEVAVVVRRGAVRISARGLLERPARIGEATSVRLLADRRIVLGRLEDAQTVSLDGGPR